MDRGRGTVKQIFTSVLVLLSICFSQEEARSNAAPVPPECPFGLSEVFELAEEQLKNLYMTRGVDRPYGIGAVRWEFAEAMGRYLSHQQEKNSPSLNASLVYITRGEEVCVIYSRAENEFRVRIDLILLPETASEISSLIDRNIDEFISSGPQAKRAPTPRVIDKMAEKRSAVALARQFPLAGRPTSEILTEVLNELFPYGYFAEIETMGSLSIVPALNMGRVPFAALDLNGDGKPLLDSVTINIEASLKSMLDQNIYQWTPGLANPIVFGDPDATDDPDWTLPRLPGAEREARRVSDVLGATPVIGADATKEHFLSMITDADYVHVAAHGLASSAEPMDRSFLALTSGRLTAREIQHLQLKKLPVVVLSACQTALGGPLQAGIIGISRGFLLAGAISVVSSLWNVDDEATAEIMIDFVENLSQTNPANALRRAQLAAREKWPDPRIWSAFIMFGGRIVDAQ
jgi:hypothetical protein